MAFRPRTERDLLPVPSIEHRDPSTPLHRIEEALRGLRYGHVTIIVQDGTIVQIERTEKTRLV